ncbi:MAG: SDR family NAD(P)-dependent oxidoreductase [Deltaproteobacteria bacterium]|nr:MAG: SDR family NAD(P)-dependent oxidoreductase [Deltaproteobacteria bacterium]
MSLYSRLTRVGASGFGYASTAEQVTAGLDLGGKRYLVTGCNSGLGLETVRVLALRGATVFATARTLPKAEEAVRGLAGDVRPLACELTDLASVASCAQAVVESGEKLDGIVTNAGIMALPKRELVHGVEKQLFVNHVAHFALVTGLLDQLTDDARVVSLSSTAHTDAPSEGVDVDDLAYERGYIPFKAYGQSKLANLLFARELSRRFAGTDRIACGVHPGVINTNLGRHVGPIRYAFKLLGPLFFKRIDQGAATQVWALTRAEAGLIDGQYLADCNVARSSEHGRDLALARRLWERTEELLAKLEEGLQAG